MKKVLVAGPRFHGNSVEFVASAFASLNFRTHTLTYRGFTPLVFDKKRGYFFFIIKFLVRFFLTVGLSTKIFLLCLQKKVDVVFAIRGDLFSLLLMKIIKKLKITTIVWWQDDPRPYRDMHSLFRAFDHFFIFDKHYIEKLTPFGIYSKHLPCAFPQELLAAIDQEKSELDEQIEEVDVIFAGVAYPDRIQMLEELCGLGIRIKLVGDNWQTASKLLLQNTIILKSLNPEILARHYKKAKIGINLNHKQSVSGLNCRTFELCGLGVFQITDYHSDLDCYFEIGKDLVVYNDIEDFKAKVLYYIKNDVERMEIAKSGRDRVLQHHTYAHRITTAFDLMALSVHT